MYILQILLYSKMSHALHALRKYYIRSFKITLNKNIVTHVTHVTKCHMRYMRYANII